MFLVVNKEKIYAYLVSILTVCLLFFIASTNTVDKGNDVETSTDVDSSYNMVQNENSNKEDDLVPNDEIEKQQKE